MDIIQRIILELRSEQAKIDTAILIIERLAAVSGIAIADRRRGRPPKWLAEAKLRVGAKAMEHEVMKYLVDARAPGDGTKANGTDHKAAAALRSRTVSEPPAAAPFTSAPPKNVNGGRRRPSAA